MSNPIVKHDILKKLYDLENSFDIYSLEDCQNLIGLVSIFFLEDELDEDIKTAIGIILERSKMILSQEREDDCECCCNPNREREDEERMMREDKQLRLSRDTILGPDYMDRSHTFRSLLSYRIFNAHNPDYNYNNLKKKG